MKSEPGTLAVGQTLKKRRQNLKLSLTEVELATKIRGKFLVKLEGGAYDELGHDIYTKGFVRAYGDYLGLDGRALAKQYLAERGTLPASTVKLTRPRRQRVIMTPKVILGIASILAVAAVIGYLGWQVKALAAAPKIAMTSPASDQVIDGNLIDISGQVTAGADVSVNDSPILTDANGKFSDQLALQDGLNTIRVTARNKLGRVSTLTRNILAHNPVAATPQATAATITGVQVQATIKGSATWLVVAVDGTETFHGTMLAGTTQTFSGTSQITISTGNAGATSLVVTNQVAAGKNIPSLGANGQIRRDLAYTATTVVP